MARPIDDTEMLVTIAWEIVDGRAETATGAMRLYGIERGTADERRLQRKWAIAGAVAMAAMRRAEVMRDDANESGFELGRLFPEPSPLPPSRLARRCWWGRGRGLTRSSPK